MRWRARAERQDQLEDREVLDAIGGRGEPLEGDERPFPGAHVAPAPTGLRRILGSAAQQPGDRRRVAHLDDAAQQRDEVVAERAMAGDVRLHEAGVAPIVRLIAADEPPVVGGVGLDHPERRMVRDDVLVGVRAPFLVGSADEVHAQLRQDVGRVVQRLRQVLETTPDEQVERARIGGPRALDDPARSLGGLAHARVRRHFGLALLRDRAQRVRRRIAIRVAAQVRIVALVAVDHLEDVALAPRPVRRRHQAFQVEHVGVEQQVDHRLLVVGVGAADVRRDEDAMADAVERAAGRRRLLRGSARRRGDDAGHSKGESEEHTATEHRVILWSAGPLVQRGGRLNRSPKPGIFRSMAFRASSMARLRMARRAMSPTSTRTDRRSSGPVTVTGSVTRPPSCV